MRCIERCADEPLLSPLDNPTDMEFDSSPEAMKRNGQIWFPGDYDRIRMWTGFGRTAVIRPALPPDAASELGYGNDIFWVAITHIDREEGNIVYADWMASRPDLGISVMASKMEVAVNGYFERLLRSAIPPKDITVKESMGTENARGIMDQMSSRNTGYVLLSNTDRSPVSFETDSSITDLIESTDNILPFKRSVYDKEWTENHKT